MIQSVCHMIDYSGYIPDRCYELKRFFDIQIKSRKAHDESGQKDEIGILMNLFSISCYLVAFSVWFVGASVHRLQSVLLYILGTILKVHCSYVLQQISWHSDRQSSLDLARPSGPSLFWHWLLQSETDLKKSGSFLVPLGLSDFFRVSPGAKGDFPEI